MRLDYFSSKQNRHAPGIYRRIGNQTRAKIRGQFRRKNSLRELCAGLKSCKLVLTNDTGPMHVAAALGTPVVVPFGSTSFELTGPGLPGSTGHALLKSDVPCAPCFLRECPIDFRCMQSIGVEQVVTACHATLQETCNRRKTGVVLFRSRPLPIERVAQRRAGKTNCSL